MGLGRLVWGGGDCSLLYTLVILLMCIIIVVVQYSVSSTLYNATGVCALYIWVWIPGSKISVDIDEDPMDSFEFSHIHLIICNAVQSIGAPNRPTPVLWHMNIWFKCSLFVCLFVFIRIPISRCRWHLLVFLGSKKVYITIIQLHYCYEKIQLHYSDSVVSIFHFHIVSAWYIVHTLHYSSMHTICVQN